MSRNPFTIQSNSISISNILDICNPGLSIWFKPVTSGATSSNFYRLPPDKENTVACRYLFSFALNFFCLAAVDSKTSSRARDRRGDYTQKSKMVAQNGVPNNEFHPLFLRNERSVSRHFVNNNITIHKLHNKQSKKEKIFWTFPRT